MTQETDSGGSRETEPIGAAVQFVGIEHAGTPIVIAADDNQVTFTLNVPISVLLEATFSFRVKDAIDRDVVTLDATTRAVERSVEMELVIRVARPIGLESGALDVEVSSLVYLPVDFGHIPPFEDELPLLIRSPNPSLSPRCPLSARSGPNSVSKCTSRMPRNIRV